MQNSFRRNSPRWRYVRVVVLICAGSLLLIGYGPDAMAADKTPACVLITNDSARLACYDHVDAGSEQEKILSAVQQAAPTTPSLTTIWELDAEHKRGTFRLLPYRATYFLPLRYSNSRNVTPGSPTENHSVSTPLPLSATEAKIQFSARFKVWETLFKNNGDLWFGYTQQSNWQLYNGNDYVSAAFRETNYEPEVILTLRTDHNLLGWHWRMLNLGFVHQSNGRELPLSRSWNRIYGEFGFERNGFVLSVRPWLRLPEKSEKDDNPDMRRYMGSSDTRLTYIHGGSVYSMLGRYSFSGQRGALQLDWAFPISGALKGYLQIFNGYGESLIDYNHSQTVLGVGVLLVPWQ